MANNETPQSYLGTLGYMTSCRGGRAIPKMIICWFNWKVMPQIYVSCYGPNKPVAIWPAYLGTGLFGIKLFYEGAVLVQASQLHAGLRRMPVSTAFVMWLMSIEAHICCLFLRPSKGPRHLWKSFNSQGANMLALRNCPSLYRFRVLATEWKQSFQHAWRHFFCFCLLLELLPYTLNCLF